MFSFIEPKKCYSKALVADGVLPNHVDPQQPPSKKKPFSSIMSQHFTHTIEVLLPEELYELVWQRIDAKTYQIQYSQVIMPLSALLDGDFFNLYIKTGNILMLSEGRAGIDDKYYLKDGLLHLELAKERYERSGLVGKVVSDGGRKHMKTRFAVEIDLRQPSMLHGKKGFERIVWAFKNVLNQSVTWLFHDFDTESNQLEKPIDKHHPVTKLILPHKAIINGVIVPNLDPTHGIDSDGEFEAWALDIYEWESLVGMESPRVNATDSIDAYLSRYQIPLPPGDSQKPQNIVRLSWSGLLPAKWVRNLFIELSIATSRIAKKRQAFFFLNANAFLTKAIGQQDGYTILCLYGKGAGNEREESTEKSEGEKGLDRVEKRYVLWEIFS